MSEQSNKVEKIKKSSNVAMFLARIGKIFMIAMAGISVVCGIGLLLLDVTADAQTRQKLDAVELAAGNSLFFGALAGIAFWCVYCILDYGCELQRQSDETL